MPLTPEQLQELQELEELDQLEQEVGGKFSNEMIKSPEQQAIFNQAAQAGMGPASQAMAPGMQKLLSPVLKPILNAARRSKVLEQVKNPAGLAQNVKEQITSGLGQFNEKAIKPTADKLREFLSGKSVPVSPAQLEGASPAVDRYARQLWKKNLQTDAPNLRTSPVDVSANVANKLKQRAADEARYAKSKTFSPGSEAKAEAAGKVADRLRSQVEGLGPEVSQSNQKLQDLIQTRNRIRELSDTAPVETLQGRIGSSKGSLVADIDKAAGTKLGQLGEDISLAQKRLGSEPLAQGILPKSAEAMINKLVGYVPRAGGAVASRIEPIPQALLNDPKYGAILSQILTKRRQ